RVPLDFKEVRALEVTGESLGVAPDGPGVDRDVHAGDLAISDRQHAAEVPEPSVMRARDLGCSPLQFATGAIDHVSVARQLRDLHGITHLRLGGVTYIATRRNQQE